jgi:hypothetical protein
MGNGIRGTPLKNEAINGQRHALMRVCSLAGVRERASGARAYGHLFGSFTTST